MVFEDSAHRGICAICGSMFQGNTCPKCRGAEIQSAHLEKWQDDAQRLLAWAMGVASSTTLPEKVDRDVVQDLAKRCAVLAARVLGCLVLMDDGEEEGVDDDDEVDDLGPGSF